MRLSKGLLIGGLVSCACLAWLLPYGCNKKPTEPPPEVKEYLFYFLDGLSTDCFVYSPTRGLLDTFQLPFAEPDLRSASLSADGRTMFIKTWSSTYAMNMSTLDTVRILDESRSVIASPDGRYLAIADAEFLLLDATDYSVVFQDTMGVWAGCFSADHRTFYGGGMAYHGYVYKLSLEDGFSRELTWFYNQVPMAVAVSPDESRWFLYSASIVDDCASLFDVYDAESDSVIFSSVVRPGLGDLAMARGGKYVYFTNPGYPPLPNPGCPDGSYLITVFHPGSNQLLKKISTIATYGEAGYYYLNIRSLSATPDGKWILGLTSMSGYLLIDAEAASVSKFEAIGHDIFAHYLVSPMAQTGM